MRRLRAFAFVGAIALNFSVRPQALEGLLIERYHTQLVGKDTLTTYRFYVDLAKDHTLQMVFGSEKHFLRFETTTEFFNDTVNGAIYADRIDEGKLNGYPLALDSWLTMAAASKGHIGVPLDRDPDGSILQRKAYGIDPAGKADGLVAADVKQVVNFKWEPGYLNKVRGATLLCTDCAWSVLGGVRGTTEENLVLIAQLSTTGQLSYELNLQIGVPGGGFVRCVASDATGEEVLAEMLARRPERLRR